MGNPYSAQTISGYNTSPPPDDGSQTAANRVSWSTQKTKLADPIKTLAQGIDAAVTNFGAIAKTQGLQTIWLPAGSFNTRSTLGATGLVSSESASNKVMQYAWQFTATARKHVQSTPIGMPRSWNESSVTAMIYWRNSATGNVTWGIQALSMGDGDTYDASFSTAVSVTDSCSDTTTLRVTALSGNIIPAGSPAEDDITIFQVYNDCTATTFTASGTVSLIGMRLYYTDNQWTDATATA